MTMKQSHVERLEGRREEKDRSREKELNGYLRSEAMCVSYSIKTVPHHAGELSARK